MISMLGETKGTLAVGARKGAGAYLLQYIECIWSTRVGGLVRMDDCTRNNVRIGPGVVGWMLGISGRVQKYASRRRSYSGTKGESSVS